MAFESLSEKLQNVFRNLRGKGRLSEADVKSALKEVKMALLEADVNFRVVKQFVNAVTEKAIGQDVMSSLTPGQMVIKIVNEELTSLMGSETTEIRLNPQNEITVIMMAGLQGAGKTTTSAKIGGKLKAKGRKPLLVACDVYRPAAVKQLQVVGEKLGIPVFSMGTGISPVDIAKAALVHAKEHDYNVVILDTAGRLHIDEDMMQELSDIQAAVKVDQTLFVVDAMTGQDAVNVAKPFNERIELDGIVLTKLDGDSRGGAALSIRSVTGKPILYVGMGEKLSDLEQFYPDRMASRILGMGDMLTLIEKAQQSIDEEEAAKSVERMLSNTFSMEDLLSQFEQIKKLGSMKDVIGMIPGAAGKVKEEDLDDKVIDTNMAIIRSMTKKERRVPNILNASRRRRIAAGSGTTVQQVNQLIRQYEQTSEMMKKFSKMTKGKKGLGKMAGMGKGGFPGMGNPFGKGKFPF